MLGEIIKGQYQIVQILSSSDYCQTYLAQDLVTPSPQACIVKHLLPGPSSRRTSSLSSLRRVFTREVAALEKLSTYSQVPQLLNYFELEQQFYLVLEYIHGQPLNRVLTPGVRWSETQVIDFLQEVLTILEVIHAHGLIHRDIKPSNLIQRDSDGKLVLIDFGSVKQAWTQVVTAGGQTNANFAMGIPATMAIGTPGYMPSEQSRGRPRPNSDIYALGMIAIQALTGMQPTMLLEDADTGEVIWQHLTNVTLGLGSILNQMVRYHFTERYQSATEVLADLQPLLPAAAPSQPTPTPRSSVSNSASNSVSYKGSAANGSGTKSRRTSTGGQQQIALWLGMAIGITSALGLILGLYYALRPGSKAVPPIAPPKAQFATIASNTLSDSLSLTQTLTGGQILVSGGGEKTVLTEHENRTVAIAYSTDGNTLMSASLDRTIEIWQPQSGQLLHDLLAHANWVLAIAPSPRGQTLVSSSKDRTIKIWE